MVRSDAYYYYPVFTTYRNDVPVTSESGIMEATHIYNLYYCYANKHNNHSSPYSEWHPDPLERRIHQYPDVEVYTFEEGEPLWFLGTDTSHALNGAYRQALTVFGDALQPQGWNRRQPWRDYDFSSRLARLGMPYIPKPLSFTEDPYHGPFESFEDLQFRVHHNNFYAMCLTATALVVNAVKMNNFHNLVHAGYMRGSPGFVAAHRYWCCMSGHPVTDHSEDDESTADFELIAQEQHDSFNALALPSPPITVASPKEEPKELAFDATSWRDGFLPSDSRDAGSNALLTTNHEPRGILRGRRNDIDEVSNVATTSSPPVVPSSIPDVDFDDLIERLSEIATVEATKNEGGEPSNSEAGPSDVSEPAALPVTTSPLQGFIKLPNPLFLTWNSYSNILSEGYGIDCEMADVEGCINPLLLANF